MKTLQILIAGVGGQGTLLASRILGEIALMRGLDTKLSEVHGMAQRGGSVVTHVRIGEKVFSPLVEEGQADLVLSFEQLEALRALPFLGASGVMVTSTQRILPMPVVIGAEKYPEGILETLAQAVNLVAVDAHGMALELGNARVANVILLGAAARALPFERALWEKAIAACVPPKTAEINLKAFDAGYRPSA